ncbi:Hypothetical predicted protein [Scomber scombrus]|uniref:Uncharacterized protein n=1 Tax=Scomber scombrus TaxID=13677 RepID=A0AAV1PSZ4_SCOSC
MLQTDSQKSCFFCLGLQHQEWMVPIFAYVQHKWATQLNARPYRSYTMVDDWEGEKGVPAIESAVGVSLLPSAALWPSQSQPLFTGLREKGTTTYFDYCYASAAKGMALENHIAFLVGSMECLVHQKELSAKEITEAKPFTPISTVSSFSSPSNIYHVDSVSMASCHNVSFTGHHFGSSAFVLDDVRGGSHIQAALVQTQNGNFNTTDYVPGKPAHNLLK